MANTSTRGSISAIVLAAGANTRLNGIVPPYLKPLILSNGKPLLHHAVNHATQDWAVKEVIIVVSPDNAKSIVSIEDHSRQYILQPAPDGVLDAIGRAVPAATGDWLLILCADNTFDGFPHGDPRLNQETAIIGVRDDLSPGEMKRFTRYRNRFDGVEIIDANSDEQGQGCWIGPLCLRRLNVVHFLGDSDRGMYSIADLIRKSTNAGTELVAVPMNCTDLGVPEAL